MHTCCCCCCCARVFRFDRRVIMSINCARDSIETRVLISCFPSLDMYVIGRRRPATEKGNSFRLCVSFRISSFGDDDRLALIPSDPTFNQQTQQQQPTPKSYWSGIVYALRCSFLIFSFPSIPNSRLTTFFVIEEFQSDEHWGIWCGQWRTGGAYRVVLIEQRARCSKREIKTKIH